MEGLSPVAAALALDEHEVPLPRCQTQCDSEGRLCRFDSGTSPSLTNFFERNSHEMDGIAASILICVST
jgi:hypothetical protein